MPTKLTTTIEKIKSLSNRNNSRSILEFHEFMKENGSSERHQNNNLKTVLSFSQFLDSKSLIEVDKREDILAFFRNKGTQIS
jgi:hypothetical protein